MFHLFSLFGHLKPGRFNPVLEDIERRRPNYRRERILLILGLLLLGALWLLARLRGWDVSL